MPFYEDDDYEPHDFTKDYQNYKNLSREFIRKYSVEKDIEMDKRTPFLTLKTLKKNEGPFLLKIGENYFPVSYVNPDTAIIENGKGIEVGIKNIDRNAQIYYKNKWSFFGGKKSRKTRKTMKVRNTIKVRKVRKVRKTRK